MSWRRRYADVSLDCGDCRSNIESIERYISYVNQVESEWVYRRDWFDLFKTSWDFI